MYNNNYNSYGYGGYGYNNYYNPTPTPSQQTPAQPQVQQPTYTPLTFVNGIEGAKAYIVAPNSTIYLRDSDSDKIFIKSSDPQGRLTLRTYRLIEDNNELSKTTFATRDELKTLEDKIAKLQSMLEEKKVSE